MGPKRLGIRYWEHLGEGDIKGFQESLSVKRQEDLTDAEVLPSARTLEGSKAPNFSLGQLVLSWKNIEPWSPDRNDGACNASLLTMKSDQ